MTYIQYPHTLRFFETTVDGYGEHVVGDYEDVPAVFEQQTGFSHTNFQDAITSDAVALVDPRNTWVQANAYRLEELLVVANPYGEAESQSWYKVVESAVGSTHQLDNVIDTVRIVLKKTRALSYVS
jgi:hypothetical protein